MSITTFATLITTPGTKKEFLVEIQPAQNITGWSIYDSAAPTEDLVGYWKLDDGEGATAVDSSGNGNDGTLEGSAPTWVDGKSGKAVNLPGTDERVDCGNGAPLDQLGNGSFWLSFQMKSKDTVPLNYGMLFTKNQNSDNRFELYSLGTDSRFAFIIVKGGVFQDYIFSLNLDIFDATWRHIILVINRTIDKILCYVDTVKDATELNIDTLPADVSNTGNVVWGSRVTGSNPYEGGLDEMRIYTGVPTEAEVLALYNDGIYKNQVGTVHVQSITDNGSDLTKKTAINLLEAGSWYYDGDYIYLRATTATPYQRIIVAKYKVYYATEGKIFNDYYYQPFVAGIPKIIQSKPELYWGVSIVSNGAVRLKNDNGHFDNIFESYAWENAEITVLAGGEDLAYTEYATMFSGKITKKSMTTGEITFDFEDRKRELENTLPLNSFGTTDYPNLDSEDVGKPIPYLWGTCYRVPVICTNRAESTSTYNFKICDTSTHSITAISTVYVNDIAVTPTSTSISAATFNLNSSIYTSGDEVTGDISGYISGTVISNPIDVTEEIGILLGVADSTWNTSTRSTARAEAESNNADVGLFIGEYLSGLESIAFLMKSIMGNFYSNNEGKYAVSIWDVDLPSDPDILSDIEIKNLKTWAATDEIRKVIRCGWRKNWMKDSYAYAQNTSSETEYIYNIKKTRTINTLLSTQAGVDLFLSHMELLYRNSTILMSFDSKLVLATKNIGDRFQLSFRRRRSEDNYTWIDSKNVEIQKIEKDFDKSEYRVTVDDLKSIGQQIGHWVADDLAFPQSLDGATITAWDDDWSDSQKAWVLGQSGFWCDDDSFIFPGDAETLNKSKWW